jgi:hypothetical protein
MTDKKQPKTLCLRTRTEQKHIIKIPNKIKYQKKDQPTITTYFLQLTI